MKKRGILLLFTLLTAAALLVSCNRDQPGEVTGEDFEITGDYVIIRPDNADKSVVRAATSLTGTLRNKGLDPDIGTDFVDRNGVAEVPLRDTEILIGQTERAESKEAAEGLGEHRWLIRAVGKKIVILGSEPAATVQAVGYFIDNYLNGETGLRVPADLSVEKEMDYMYLYRFTEGSGESYDACVTEAALQGLFNRESTHPLYMTSPKSKLPDEFLTLMRSDNRWMSGYGFVEVGSFDALLDLVRPFLKCVVIWDETVPATLNAATTAAGCEDGAVMTGKQYEAYRDKLPEKVIDLRNKFDGSRTGSVKNDVYRWAIDEYLASGKCGTSHLCSFEDSFFARQSGDVRYVINRDFAVFHRAFVFDLSVWSDEVPQDDMKQKKGTDLETYEAMLAELKRQRPATELTEIDGFFSFNKYSLNGNNDAFTSKYYPTQFEWDAARIFTPYGCYWNSVAEWSYNMTVHRLALPTEPLKQNRPETEKKLKDDDGKVYLLLVTGDYDATGSIYTKMYDNWNDPGRGKLPLAWSYNPNLLEEYPDILSYFYETATPNDYFVSNAGAAGWFTASRVAEEDWDLYVKHNQKYFTLSDISCAPDFWDYQTFTDGIESKISKFASTGFGALVSNQLGRGTGEPMNQHIALSGVPVDPLCNRYVRGDAEACAEGMIKGIEERKRPGHATFMATRVIWSTPSYIDSCVKKIQEKLPDYSVEVVDPYTYYRLLGESLMNE